MRIWLCQTLHHVGVFRWVRIVVFSLAGDAEIEANVEVNGGHIRFANLEHDPSGTPLTGGLNGSSHELAANATARVGGFHSDVVNLGYVARQVEDDEPDNFLPARLVVDLGNVAGGKAVVA